MSSPASESVQQHTTFDGRLQLPLSRPALVAISAAVVAPIHIQEMKRQMRSAWPVALSPAFACKMSAVYHWASACVLLALHCIVLLQQYVTLAYRQWGFRQRKQQLKLRGIRPAAPRCLAIALVDSETDIEDLKRLPMLLDWCVAIKCGLDTAA